MNDEKKVRVGKIAGRALAEAVLVLATPESKKREEEFTMACQLIGPHIAEICKDDESPIIRGLGMGIADVSMGYATETSK